MQKITNYLSGIYGRQEQKKESLDSMFHRFSQLMGLTDEELRIHSSNERVLPKDPVYNSGVSSNDLKDAIKTRKFSDKQPKEFEDLYKQVLYGYSDQVPSETSQVKPQPTLSEALVKAGTNLDVIQTILMCW